MNELFTGGFWFGLGITSAAGIVTILFLIIFWIKDEIVQRIAIRKLVGR